MEGRGHGVGLSTLYPLPTQTFLQVSVCLKPKWLPLVDVSAQVPSHAPRRDVGKRHGTQAPGPGPPLVLKKPQALSPKGKLI